ncbi:MAG: NTP transferase domain-containing protein [Planctomycetota bacterium JB042]
MTALRATAIVLAAGRSSRMGTDKALLDLGGEPALGRVIRILREVPVSRVVVVLRPIGAALRRSVDLTGVTTAINVDPESGQSASLRIGWKNVESSADAVVLCPVDVPLFEADDVRSLLAAFRSRPDGARIVAPSVDGRRGHPVVFSTDVAREFAALGPDEPAHGIVRRDPARVVHVPSTNRWLVDDLDTPEEYAEAVRALEGRGPLRES